MRGAAIVLGFVAVLASALTPATAQRVAPRGAATDSALLYIEDVDVVGNVSTATRLVRRAVPIKQGEWVRADDPRFKHIRYKVLALGYFRSVEVKLRKGAKRGQVILQVTVKERGTVVLNKLLFGTSRATPWWAGIDLTERNFLGSGIGVGGGFVYAGEGPIDGARRQYSMNLHVGDPSILGSKYGAHGSFLRLEASEPYRVAGELSDGAPDNFKSFSYSRTGATAGMNMIVTTLSQLTIGARFERVYAQIPDLPARTLPGGQVVPVALGLLPGTSNVVTISAGFERDTRVDPVLPFNGNKIAVLGEVGARWLGGDYDYATILARYQHWWPLHSIRHVLSLHLTGGLILGEAPRFDRFHVADLNRLLTPRALGLVVSTAPTPNVFDTAADETVYGELGGAVEVQYTYRLFRSRRHVYGGDLFFGLGLWALGNREDVRSRDRSWRRSLPVDLLIDAGLRLDTEIGIFELTFANALGRVPL